MIDMNLGMVRLLNKSKEQLLGKIFTKVFEDAQWAEILTLIEESFSDSTDISDYQLSVNFNGSSHDVYFTIDSVLSTRGKVLGKMVKIHDISRISQSERTLAWAGMAQKLAHEIKTPLSTVMLSAQKLEMEFERMTGKHEKSNDYLDFIIQQVHRLRELSDAFLKFAHLDELHLEAVEIENLIDEVLDELRLKMIPGFKVIKEYSNDLPRLNIDKQQMSIVFHNVITNSMNAMGEKGVLTITTRLVQSLQLKLGTDTSNMVQIEISDTGKGIGINDLNSIFQPFFSKMPGGTGMGLVIVKKIIEDHHGSINIESKEGIGTNVFIDLPVCKLK